MSTIFKYKFLLFVIIFNGFLNAQPPTDYYKSATGSGLTLKTQLYNIIKDHTDQGYSGLWVTYNTSDRDLFVTQGENDGTIYDIYSENPSGNDPYNFTYATNQCGNFVNEGDCYNREHIIPQSIFNELPPMVSDAHFVPPTDGKVNGLRSNFPHGNVATISGSPTQNGSKLGSSAVSGYTGTVFEPNAAFKGDIARMYFYFVTRYENVVAGYNYDMFAGNNGLVFTNAFKDLLVSWHNADPVSPYEIARNNAIYVRQGNRNPFIDQPNWVNAIWGTTIADTQAPSMPTDLAINSITSNSAIASWTASTDNIGVTSYDVFINNVFYSNTSTTSANLNGLQANTSYTLGVKAKDAAGNLSNEAIVMFVTKPSSGGASDLFISEYVEGSGNTKVLELVNFTGSTVDLSTYSIKRQTNGAGAWSSPLKLSGNLNNGSVFTIMNSQTDSNCLTATNANKIDDVVISFNGNDPMGLFKNDVLIDIIGKFNGGSADFAKDITLRRKSNISSPNTTYTIQEWDDLPINNCSGLGKHNFSTLSNLAFENFEITIYPNPNSGSFVIETNSNDKISIEIVNSLGQIIHKSIIEKSNSVENLQSGLYFLKVYMNQNVMTKKILVK